jgi:O-antigen ligase
LRHPISTTQRAIATCGTITVLGYLGFGMTQMLFAHNSGNVVFLFMNLLWLAALQPFRLNTPTGAPQ